MPRWQHTIAPTAKKFDADIIINIMGYNDFGQTYVIESTRMLAEIAAGQILCSELSDTEAIKAAVKLNENPQYPGKTK